MELAGGQARQLGLESIVPRTSTRRGARRRRDERAFELGTGRDTVDQVHDWRWIHLVQYADLLLEPGNSNPA
jgi:hypothetical protein